MKVNEMLDLSKTIAAPLFDGVAYPWEVLPKIEEYIIRLGSTLSEDEYELRGENIWVAKTAKIAPTASITGPVIICAGAEVRHCAFIRGKAIVGKNAVVGNSTELKNVVLFDNVQVPHYNYVGDSVLGYKVHMGAGSITSNVKSDKTLVTIKADLYEGIFEGDLKDGRIKTGLKKMGAILGDNVEIGCNSVLNPGTVIGKGSNVYPVSCVRGYVPAQSIVKAGGVIVKKN